MLKYWESWETTKFMLYIFAVVGGVLSAIGFVLLTPIFITFFIFLTAKIAGAILWSWWMVTMPLWITPLIVICLGTLLLVVGLITDIVILGYYKIKGIIKK